MVVLLRPYKMSGMVSTSDRLHNLMASDAEEIAPIYVVVPGGKKVAQYSPTIVGSTLSYSPDKDCDGNFTASKFQMNNNCYNYACRVATNSFAQPGRKQGFFLESEGGPTGPVTTRGAEMDGLIWIGRAEISDAQMRDSEGAYGSGHLVALLISQADHDIGWTGDYHWVRCDNNSFSSWSQKDGGDQASDRDFAGKKLRDPRRAIWKVNEGPIIEGNIDDIKVKYDFYGFMFVPAGRIDII
jgi:hypothetical protein